MNEQRGPDPDLEDELRPEYDFEALMENGGRTGVYADCYAEGTNVVLLDPDVARAFRDSEAVNAALRLLIEAARLTQPLTKQ